MLTSFPSCQGRKLSLPHKYTQKYFFKLKKKNLKNTQKWKKNDPQVCLPLISKKIQHEIHELLMTMPPSCYSELM